MTVVRELMPSLLTGLAYICLAAILALFFAPSRFSPNPLALAGFYGAGLLFSLLGVKASLESKVRLVTGIASGFALIIYLALLAVPILSSAIMGMPPQD